MASPAPESGCCQNLPSPQHNLAGQRGQVFLQLSTVNCQLSTATRQPSTVNCQQSFRCNQTWYYSMSLRLGFRAGSLDKNPNMNRETKNSTTTLTTILRVSTVGVSKKAIGLSDLLLVQPFYHMPKISQFTLCF